MLNVHPRKKDWGIKWGSGKSSFCLTEKWTQRVSIVASQNQVIRAMVRARGTYGLVPTRNAECVIYTFDVNVAQRNGKI
jgi:hypothetical protein